MAANGLESKNTRTAEILLSRRWYHSATGDVPAGVSVTKSARYEIRA